MGGLLLGARDPSLQVLSGRTRGRAYPYPWSSGSQATRADCSLPGRDPERCSQVVSAGLRPSWPPPQPRCWGRDHTLKTAGGCGGKRHVWVQPAVEGAADLPSSLCPTPPARSSAGEGSTVRMVTPPPGGPSSEDHPLGPGPRLLLGHRIGGHEAGTWDRSRKGGYSTVAQSPSSLPPVPGDPRLEPPPRDSGDVVQPSRARPTERRAKWLRCLREGLSPQVHLGPSRSRTPPLRTQFHQPRERRGVGPTPLCPGGPAPDYPAASSLPASQSCGGTGAEGRLLGRGAGRVTSGPWK